MQYYQIGDVVVSLNYDVGYELIEDCYIKLFSISEEQAKPSMRHVRYKSEYQSLADYIENPLVESNSYYRAFQTEKGKLFVYSWATCRHAFALWPEHIHAEGENTILFDPKMREEYPMSTNQLFSISGMHRVFLELDAPVLHASYIEWGGQAILFTAPSRTGKSTQADLWQRYAGAEIINGDRVLLRQRDGVWHAYGYPACGSSKICLNRTLPIKAIIVLEQGQENSIISMTASEKIRALTSATEVYVWDYQEIDKAFSLAEQLINDVPVFKLCCRPDEEAVTVLQDYLLKKL